MNDTMVQIIVLAGILLFLVLKLRSVLGTREGFEKPRVEWEAPRRNAPDLEVIEGGADADITDHVPAGSKAARALAEMKKIEPDFSVTEFLQGARGAYEMILMAFENGDLESVVPFLSEDVYEAFASVIDEREEKGLIVEATFVGLREMELKDADFDPQTQEAEITVKFISELTSVVRNREGEIIEGNPEEIHRQKDVWTFARIMGSDDPNWKLVATDG